VCKEWVLLVEPAAMVTEPDLEAFNRWFSHYILETTAGQESLHRPWPSSLAARR
jgi:hypothetical protein